MRKNFRNVGFYPQPVLVVGTYDQDGIPDAMNVGWGGLVGGTYVELNISRGHKTTENIRQKRAFTLSFADQANLVAAGWSPAMTCRTRSPGRGSTPSGVTLWTPPCLRSSPSPWSARLWSSPRRAPAGCASWARC